MLRYLRVLLPSFVAVSVATCIPALAARMTDPALAAGVPELRAVRDLGRAPAAQPISIALTLAYERDDELQQLIALQGDARLPYYHRFLSNSQFASYFGPSAGTEERAVVALERAGFRITGRYANRTVVDAVAPAAVAERYFATEIHRVAQSDAGLRYANVRPATLPAELRGLVTGVTGLTNVIYARTAMAALSTREKAAAKTRALAVFGANALPLTGTRIANFNVRAEPAAGPAAATTGNEIRDPSFESGSFGAWQKCAAYAANDPAISTARAHTGKRAGFAGSLSATSGEIKLDAGVCEGVTIPTNGILSFWVYQYSNETNAKNAFQEADLVDATGKRIVNFYASDKTTSAWTHVAYDVAKYAGQRDFVYFGVQGNGEKNHETYQYVDDVSLSGSAYPATGGKIGGPLLGPDGGYGPAVVADSYDFPVQHGYDGSGRATGVAISGDYADADLYGYLDEFGITRGGTTTRVEVDGGAKFTAGGDASSEATLDVETIVSLAPSTQLYMYLFPDLSDKHVEDGYNKAVSDNIVDVLDSSFGGCESGDTAFDEAVDKIVAQAAAKGITFSASSGDSGSAACNGSAPGVEAPASTPDVVAVGGTTLLANSNGTYHSEAAWSGSGGGVSAVWALPSYQSGVKGVVGKTRNVPDIAFPADPNAGTAFLFSGEWSGPLGGTSWASPIFCALLTESDERHNSRAGYVNPALYAVYKKDGALGFHDVTTGNNGAYAAHVGYDDVTGLGSLRGFYFSGAE